MTKPPPPLSTVRPDLFRPSTSFARAARPKVVDARYERGHDQVGLVPAAHLLFNAPMAGGWFYFMTNRRNGILYAGVTSNLPRRAFEHRSGAVEGFTKRYGLKRLVYYEHFDDIRQAIQREKTIKHWPRAWKVRLIHAANPEWDDLYDTLI